VRFVALTAVRMIVFLFWVVKSCGTVGGHRNFGGTYCLHLQDWQCVSPKCHNPQQNGPVGSLS
jgi:hypothetical protein